MPGYTPPAPMPVPPPPPSYIGGVPFEAGGFYGQPTPQQVLPTPRPSFGNIGTALNQVVDYTQQLGSRGGALAGSTIAQGGLLGMGLSKLGAPNTIATGGLGALPGSQATHENIAATAGGIVGGIAPMVALYAAAPEVGIPTATLDAYFGARGAIGAKDTWDAYRNGQIDAKTALLQALPDILQVAPLAFHGIGLAAKVAPEIKAAAEESPAVQRMGGLAGERGSVPLGPQPPSEDAGAILDQLRAKDVTPEQVIRGAREQGAAEQDIAWALKQFRVEVPLKPPVGPEGPKAAEPAAAEGANLPAPPETMAVEQTPLDRAILETTQALKSAEKLRPEQEAMFKQQRAAQLGAAEQAFQSGQGVEAARAAAGGRFERPTFEPLNLSPENLTALKQEIDTTPKLTTGERFAANAGLEALMRGELPEPKQIGHLNTVLGPDFTAALLDKVPVSMWGHIVDAANLPRTLLASVDLSAPFRQGIVLAPGHPKEFVSSFGAMLKAALNDKNALMYDEAIMKDPLYSKLLNAGLDHVKEYGTASVMKEEAFMSRMAEQFPVLGPLIRGSERAYVTFLNKLRWDTAYTIVKGWQESGRPITEEELHNLALFLNNATGRGTLGKAASLGPSLNALFFSPRLLASRGQLVADLFRPTQSAVVRQQAMRDLAAFIGTGTGILSLIKLSGMGNVQMDPRSSDFGKIQLGNTRIDFWGGFQPIVRYAAQLAPVQGKFAGTKVIQGSNGNVVVPADWGHTFTRFLRSKLAPIPSLGVDVQQGQDFLGNPVGKESFTSFDRQNPALSRVTPLAFQDLADALMANGFAGIATGAAGALGLGVSTQEKNPKFIQQADKEQASQRLQKSGFQPIADKFSEYEDARKAYLDKAGSADDPAARQARAAAAAKWDKANAQYLPSLHQKALTFWTPKKALLKQLYDSGMSWDALGLTPTQGKKLLGIK